MSYTETGILITTPRLKYVAAMREYPDKTLFGVFTEQEDFLDRKAKNNRFGIEGNWELWHKPFRSYKNVSVVSDELNALDSMFHFRSPAKNVARRVLDAVAALSRSNLETPCLDEYIDNEYREIRDMVIVAYPALQGKHLEYHGGWLLLKGG